MNKKQKLEAIYNQIANKELSFGCRFNFTRPNTFFHNFKYTWILTWNSKLVNKEHWPDAQFVKIKDKLKIDEEWVTKLSNWNFLFRVRQYEYYWIWWLDYKTVNKNNVIGHPVMIWDVLDFLEKNNIEKKEFEKIKLRKQWVNFTYTPVVSLILSYWKDKRLPIEKQDELLISYIFNLIKE